MTTELLILRLIHILGGIIWVGGGLFLSLFLLPAAAKAGAAAGPIMSGLQQRRLFTIMPIIAALTLLSGIRLIWITSGGFAAAYFALAPGQTYAASGVAATLAFLLGMLVARPAAMRAAKLGPSLANAPDDASRAALSSEISGLQRRSASVGTVSTVLLVLAAAGMAVARYLY